MANYTQNGTYSLPVGGDFSATVDANLTDVVFNLTSTLPSTFTIEANIGSSVTIDATSNVTTVVNVITNGGSITLGTGLVGHLLAVNATITSGGTFATPAALLTQLNGGSITFGAGGGTNVVGTEATPLNLSSSRIVYGFIGSADVFDDKSLTFSEVSSYSVGGTNADGEQTITLQAGDSSLSFITFGANVAPGLYSSTTTGPLLLANDGTGGTDIVAQDTAVPAAPGSLVLAAASDTGAAGDGITSVATPAITGSGEPGDLVTLFDGTTAIGSATVGADGWSVTPADPLADGSHTLTASQTDPAGHTSGLSNPLTITIDKAAPTVTAVTASPSDAIVGADALVTLTLDFSEVVTVADGTPTLTLNNGATATYASGSGTDSLTFDYTVAGGQDVSDLAVTGANLNGATITDRAGNNADLTGAAGNPPGTLDIQADPIAAFDVTDNQPVGATGQPYTGPVAGIQHEYINITPNNLNVATNSPDWFIHSGSGDDAIAVRSGTNVLDGGTGSSFLTGGSGTDTFFVDNRGNSADTWSTIVNFHAGDDVTVWGVTPGDFNFAFEDSQGAAAFTGLTLHATAPNRPTASVTFAGFTMADLSNGRISESSGTDPVSGSMFREKHGGNLPTGHAVSGV
jgi:hypothetical protein